MGTIKVFTRPAAACPVGARREEGGRGGGGASGVAQSLLSGATIGNVVLSETLVPRGGTDYRLNQPVPCQPPQTATPTPLP